MHASTIVPGSQTFLRELSFLWLEITGKCNLECVHCYADSGPHQDMFGSMKTEDWLTILRESAELGCRQVQFIGGEPTLHPDLTRMISYASALGYAFIEVFTNATVFNDKLFNTFKKHNVRIATSFYTDISEVHDSITKRPGSFQRTVAQIKRVIDAGLTLRAGIIEMKENTGHAERAKLYLEVLGVKEIKIDHQRGVGRSATPVYTLDPMSQLCGECWDGKLCVTPAGRAYPCVFSRFADVGAARDGISHILHDSPLLGFRTAQIEYERRKEDQRRSVSGREVSEHDLDLRCDPSCSPCPPVHFCVPERMCAPDMRCGPTAQPCSPDISCQPTKRVIDTP
jgi:MoaA/NifB/PqqE/SkfB family radical SAM enzyme